MGLKEREQEPEYGQFERNEPPHRCVVTRHPSFGVIRLSHVQGGGGELFGSAVKHQNYVEIVVEQAEHTREVELHYEHVFGTQRGRGPLLRIAMSHVQLADLMFNANRGSGTPCTIKECRDGDFVEVWKETVAKPPEATASKRQYIDEFKADMAELGKVVEAARALAMEQAAAKTVNKGDREKLAAMLNKIEMEIKSNMPFTLKQFVEKVEDVTMQAKAEVAASVTSTLNALGLKAAQDSQQSLLGFQPDETGKPPA